MRRISLQKIEGEVAKLAKTISLYLPPFVQKALSRAAANEGVSLAKQYLNCILRNLVVAQETGLPLCQDTGLFTVLIECGDRIIFLPDGPNDLDEAVQQGIARATREGRLRPSVVDPLSRKNTGDNTPAIVHFSLKKGQAFRLTVLAKGFGSENASALSMMPPTVGWKGVKKFVIDQVRKIGPNACPPYFLGIGLGGTPEMACLLAKKALVELALKAEKLDSKLRFRENQIKKEINQLGIGAGGFGGHHTVLAVRLKTYPTHIAGLPVAVNLSCWAHRVAQIEL
ncbi:MAG: fumarate hydratase [Candidatus Omnitrophica bacterium]|nr:fumarate hydratase [Candidatus Omnitrophota bacterium]